MSTNILIPSIENRLGAWVESARRNDSEKGAVTKRKPTITLSREFGCEAYPVAEILHKLLEDKTGGSWPIMDKALLEKVSQDHNLSEKTLKELGEKAGFFDEILTSFSPTWKTEKDYYRLLCQQIISLAIAGHVILVGRGSANITQRMKNCYHFRLFASMDFKISSIALRMGISNKEAEKLIINKQKQRDMFTRDFLNKDGKDLSVYHLIFNNDKNQPEQIAATIMEYVYRNSSVNE